MTAQADPARTRAAVLDFLAGIARPGASLTELNDDDNLIDSGVIDSLAMLHVIMHLESAHSVDLAARGIDPGELVTLSGILRAIRSPA